MSDKNKVYIFDTTMRDGEQSPGASMSLEEKIQIARVFDELGIDIIEAGFPIASPGDFEAVSEVSKNIKNSTITGLARASLKDIVMTVAEQELQRIIKHQTVYGGSMPGGMLIALALLFGLYYIVVVSNYINNFLTKYKRITVPLLFLVVIYLLFL